MSRFKRSVRLYLIVVILLSLFLALIPAGCQSPGSSAGSSTTLVQTSGSTTAIPTTATPTVPTTTATVPTTTAATTAPTSAPLPANPLTGEPLPNPQAAGQRPVAIMINNIKIATPQIGISQADLIYEMPVEGGITRLMAVFADVTTVPEIGSIRSARHDYIDLAGGLDAIYIHFGASDLAENQFIQQKTAHLSLMNYTNSYWRDPEWAEHRGQEHSVKTTGDRLLQAIIQSKFRQTIRENQKPAFRFRSAGDFAAADGQAAVQVSAPFSDYAVATFTYDQATRLYSKGQFGSGHLDLATGQPIKFTNVFLLLAKITLSVNGVNKEIDLSAGSGYYVSGGKQQAITWKKGNTDDSFLFLDAKGQEIPVNTGKSYIGVLPATSKVTFR